jgi:hypothetical protein
MRVRRGLIVLAGLLVVAAPVLAQTFVSPGELTFDLMTDEGAKQETGPTLGIVREGGRPLEEGLKLLVSLFRAGRVC